MFNRRILRTCTSATVSAVALMPLAFSSPASAETTVDSVVTTTATTLNVLNSLLAGTNEVEQAAIEEFTSAQAQVGRLIDASTVQAAEVAGGVVAFESGLTVDAVTITKTLLTHGTDGGSEVQEVALEVSEAPDLIQTLTEATAILTNEDTEMEGAGLGGLYKLQNGKILADNCATYKDKDKGNKVTGCVQKVKPTNDGSKKRDYYEYNRFGTAWGNDQASGPNWVVDKFVLGSRPRSGQAALTKGMSGYFPFDSSQLCREGGSVSIGRGSLSYTIPLVSCDNISPNPDASTETMKITNDPALDAKKPSVGVDYNQEVYTEQGKLAPNLGYYQFGAFCRGWGMYKCDTTTGTNGW